MGLHDDVERALRDAMKARDRERTSALRMAVAALKNQAIERGLGPQGRLDDQDVERVLQTEVKRRREAAEAFRDAEREEQAAKEEREAEVYSAFLPEPLSDDELEALVDAAIAEAGATDMRDMGRVMQQAMASAGGRADGRRVSAAVRDRLQAG